MFSTKGKGSWHLQWAEYWQSEASKYEKEAARISTEQQQGRMQREDGLESEPGYLASSLLRDHHKYKAACSNRDAHQRQAEIYFLAHLAGVTSTPWKRTRDGLELPPRVTDQ